MMLGSDGLRKVGVPARPAGWDVQSVAEHTKWHSYRVELPGGQTDRPGCAGLRDLLPGPPTEAGTHAPRPVCVAHRLDPQVLFDEWNCRRSPLRARRSRRTAGYQWYPWCGGEGDGILDWLDGWEGPGGMIVQLASPVPGQ